MNRDHYQLKREWFYAAVRRADGAPTRAVAGPEGRRDAVDAPVSVRRDEPRRDTSCRRWPGQPAN